MNQFWFIGHLLNWSLNNLQKYSAISANYLKIMEETISLYTVMIDQQFLRMPVEQLQKKLKKCFCKFFRDHDLGLTIQCNRKVVNILDVILNLENSTYCPYLRENNKTIYVNTESNYPPSIFRQLPKSIELRLSLLSAN